LIMKRKLRKLYALIMSCVILLTMTDMNAYAEGNVTSITVEEHVLPFTVKEGDIEIQFNIVNEWESGYQCDVILKNLGEEVYSDWILNFSISDKITDIWNCNILQNDNNLCSVKSLSYNNEIKPNEGATIGFCAEGNKCTIKNVEIISRYNEENSDNYEEQGIYKYEYTTYDVEYCIKDKWEEWCNATIKITNKDDIAIENWKLVCFSDDEIVNAYDATVSNENGTYTFKNIGYNQDIMPGQSVEFGFDVNYGEVLDVPDAFVITQSEYHIMNDGYGFVNIVKDKWEGGYVAEIQLTNQSNVIIEDWNLTIKCDDKIVNLWNGEVSDLKNGLYNIKNPQHDQNIQPNETIVIGYQAEGNKSDTTECIWFAAINESAKEDDTTGEGDKTEGDGTVGGGDIIGGGDSTEGDETDVGNDELIEDTYQGKYVEISSQFQNQCINDKEYWISEELNGLSGKIGDLNNVDKVMYRVVDVMGNKVQENNVSYNLDTGIWQINDFGLVIGYNEVIFTIYLKNDESKEESFDFMNSVYKNMEKTNVSLTDSDSDGINDYFEAIIGTSVDSDDEDQDDISDLDELMITGTNPKLKDTDENGIYDANEDFDNDGMTVLEELKYGTRPRNNDSDMDGVHDRIEIFELGTKPLDEDTDEDGITDGDEILLGTNPLEEDSDFDGILDSDELIEQETELILDEGSIVKDIKVSMSCSGMIKNQVFIENTMGIDMLSSEVVGLVGVPVEINSMVDFDQATITFSYNKDMLDDTNEDDLSMMWYDEENMQYVLLEDSVIDKDNQTVSYTTTHFSTYLLVDRLKWIAAWNEEIVYEMFEQDGLNYDIIICMDPGVSEEDFEKERKIAKQIIEQMRDNDRLFICESVGSGFGYGYGAHNTSKIAALKYIDVMNTWSPISEYNDGDFHAIKGIDEYVIDRTSGNKKIVFVINKGSSVSQFDGSWVREATDVVKRMEYPVYSISINEEVNIELEELLEKYGNKSWNVYEAESNVAGVIRKKYDSDTDGDGLLDVYEIKGVRIQNGKIVCSKPNDEDTDDDGINDFVELGGSPQKIVIDNKETYINYSMSDPNTCESREPKQGYMVVDDFDYLPYDNDTFDKIYLKRTGEYDMNGNEISGLHHVFNSNPNLLSKSEVNWLKTLVFLELELGRFFEFDYACDFLERYITEIENPINKFDASHFLGSDIDSIQTWANEAYHIMLTAEDYVEKGEKVILSKTPSNQNVGFSYEKPLQIFHFAAVNQAESRVVAEISFDGEEYTMDMKLYIFDYYDWDKNNDQKLGYISPADMYKLCICGEARFYENWGMYQSQLKWKPIEVERQKVIKEGKVKLALGIK